MSMLNGNPTARAATEPCGFTAAGLPVGLQLEAAWWQEPTLLRAGVAYQLQTDWHRVRPPMVGGSG
jgi:aspartyl-tRNA(Asn)/glutamyl-tRNA(Gln) amidotransferase subunit A